ncbi:rhodanese-like domain-containing protein [Magnetococcus sp. PR-3]|uniref:rhodanese-like domain-containing protein n=1 Tax=Magnetococcus sp. PR-3 TaxID=3120355 RepID=UPI002FCE0A4F
MFTTLRPLYALLLAFVVLLSGCSEPPYTNVDNAKLQQLVDQGVPLYDIRRPEEWRQTGIVKGSKLLSFVTQGGQVYPDFFPRFTQETKPEKPVVLICRTGNRSAYLAKYLIEKMGYTTVYNVAAGITLWRKQGLPVVRP